MKQPTDTNLIQMTADIVQRHIESHQIAQDDLLALITGVHNSLYGIAHPVPAAPELPAPKAKRKYTRRAAPDAATEQKIAEAIPDEIVSKVTSDDVEEDDVIGEIVMGKNGLEIVPATDQAIDPDLANFNEFGHPKRPEPMWND